MERWNWFLCANYSGKWIVTDGYAVVTRTGTQMQATLRLSPDADPSKIVRATIRETGQVEAIVESFGPEPAPPYQLRGFLSSERSRPEGEVTSVILTDGFTVLGLAKGSRSVEGNLS